MLVLVTGVPGSGKTAGAVDLILREYADRPLFVDGLNGLKLEHVPCDVLEWPKEVPDGAVVVVDEVQRKWRPRGPGSKVPDSVAALETHRHRGLDFILITQNPRLLDSNVRQLVGRHLHIRDTGWMGRWIYEWPECSDSVAWAKCQNKRRYSLPKRVFDLYTSASMHMKPVRKVPLLVYLVMVAALILGYLAFTIWSGAKKHEAPPLPAMGQGAAPGTVKPANQAVPESKSWIDDRVAFEPRISNKPETASAFDEIRRVVNMPLVAGGACFKGECVCYTGQGTHAGLSHAECRAWMDRPPFDPYTARQQPSAVVARAGSSSANTPSSQDENGPARGASVTVVPMPSGVENPRAESLRASPFPPGSPVHPVVSMDGQLPIKPPSLLSPYRRS